MANKLSNKRPLVVGIDLGTTFCSVAYIDPGTSKPALLMIGDDYDEYVPSMIAVSDGELVAGKGAQDLFMTGDDSRVARLFKRDIGVDKPYLKLGDKSLVAQDCTGQLLRYLKSGAEANLPDAEITSAVITVPANFNSARRKATLQAAEAAGIQVLRLINEPTAALLAHAEMYKDIDLTAPGRYLVFDFGGGTLDVTAATTGGIARASSEGVEEEDDGTPIKVVNSRGRDVGGMDIDLALFKELVSKFQERHGFDPTVGHPEVQSQLMSLAIRMKEALSRSDRFPVSWAWQGRTLEMTFSRARYRELVDSLLARAFGAVELVLSEEKWAFSDLNRIFLIGGSCLIPFVKEHFLEHVEADKVWLRPQDCRKMVAYGAALTPQYVTMSDKASAAEGVPEPEAPVIGKEPAPYSIGIVAVDAETRALVNSQILPRKTPVPTEGQHAKLFATSSDNQETLELVVLQGESRRPDQNVLIGRFRFEGLTKRPRGETQVKVTIDYDLDHNVVVHAEEVDRPGHVVRQKVLAEGLNANLKGILQEMTQQLSEATRNNELAPLDAIFIMDTTGSMFPLIGRLKDALASMLDRLQQSIPGFRLALIGYSDHDQEEPEPFLLRVIDFSQDVPALQGEIARMRPTYGGDNPEAVEDALNAATRLSWNPHARKAVVLVGDAPPHGVGAPDDYFATGCPNGFVWEDQVQMLLKQGVMFFTVLAYDKAPDPTAQRIWKDLAQRSEGKYFEFKDIKDIPLVLEACCAVRAGALEKWLTTLPAETRKKVASGSLSAMTGGTGAGGAAAFGAVPVGNG